MPGDPNPGCPNDDKGCHRVLGECTVVTNGVTPISDSNPDGRYSGTVRGTVWSGSKDVDCGMTRNKALAPDGTDYSITLTGAW